MKTFSKLGLALILLSSMCFAADICNSAVYDSANALSASQYPQVVRAAAILDSKGAEAHILATELGNFPTLDSLVMAAVKQCPNWQSPNHGVKSTLIVIAVAPTKKQMGIYAGSSYASAFGPDRMGRYRSQFMAPHFKSGDWSGGLIAASTQMSDRLTAYMAEANAPVTNTVVNEASAPTDYSGLWTFFKLLAIAAFFGFGVWMYFVWRNKQRELIDQRQQAQGLAIAAKNAAGVLLNKVAGEVTMAHIADNPGYRAASDLVDQATADFGGLANSLSMDPSNDDSSVATYRTIGGLYNSITSKLTDARRYLKLPGQDQNQSSPPSQSIPQSPIQTPNTQNQSQSRYDRPIVHKTVINNNSSNDGMLTGILVGEALGHRSEPEHQYRDPEPEYRAPVAEPEPEETFTRSSGSSGFESDAKEETESSSSSFSDDGPSSFSDGSGDSGF